MATTNGHPPPPIDAQAKLNGIVSQDASKGRVAVHTFDPDATPQEKAAAAGRAKENLKNPNANDANSTAARGNLILRILLVVNHAHICFTTSLLL